MMVTSVYVLLGRGGGGVLIMVTLVYVWYAMDLILTRLLPICDSNLETNSVLISPVPRLKK